MSARKPDVDPNRVAKDLTVSNKLGIHARPASMFVKVASQYTCEILVEKDGEQVNGKSIMGLMMLAAGPGSRIRVQADGKDAEAALEDIQALIERNFGE